VPSPEARARYRSDHAEDQYLVPHPLAITGTVIVIADTDWLLVDRIGLVVLVIGVMFAWDRWKKESLKRMNFGGASIGIRSLVEKLGVVGGVARGAVVGWPGVFLPSPPRGSPRRRPKASTYPARFRAHSSRAFPAHPATPWGFPASVTGMGVAMHQACANIAEGPSDALPDRVCLPPSVGELLSMVVLAIASPTTRSAPGDVRTLGVGHRHSRMRR
jgi:hypothetical protein